MPEEYRSAREEDDILRFLSAIIELTASHVCAYKIQKAYFDLYDEGITLLKQVVLSVRSRAPHAAVILDSKTGDIANSMDAYLRAYFQGLGVDAVVLNPYMGSDVWRGLRDYPECAGLVLVRTSNPESAEIQDVLLSDGRPLWKHVLSVMLAAQDSGVTNLVPILASTTGIELIGVRRLLPDHMPVFVAGVGAQGGDIQTLRPLLNSRRRGVVVNSSRALLYPYAPTETRWRESVTAATVAMKDELNRVRAF